MNHITKCFLIIAGLFIIQACSDSKKSSVSGDNLDPSLKEPIGNLKTLGHLTKDNSGVLSLIPTGVNWQLKKDKVPRAEFYNEAYKKGCAAKGQPQVKNQIDEQLQTGQVFSQVRSDLGQDYEFSLVTKATVKEIDRKSVKLVLANDLIQFKDSRLLNLAGGVAAKNPYQIVEVKLVESQVTGLSIPESQVIESHLQPRFRELINSNPKSTKIDCHLLNNQNSSETFAIGNVILKNDKKISATKIMELSTGEVVCERADNSLVFDKEALFKRGPSHSMGLGKSMRVRIFSNEVSSLAFNHCGGAEILDLRLLVLDDGRVLQQRTQVVAPQ